MSDYQELNALRTRMMEIYIEYGHPFTAFVPEGRPLPEEWEPVLPGPHDKGRLHPQALKRWSAFFQQLLAICNRASVPQR
jgi:hypothetical protein